MSDSHTYRGTLAWSGSTGSGYRAFDRTHTVAVADGPTLPLSADAAFGGEAALLNPEQLLVLAAASCQFLSFVSLAARRGVDVLEYADAPDGTMSGDPLWLREVRLHPRVVIAAGEQTADEDVVRLAHEAHETCYVARTLRAEVHLDVTVARVGSEL